MLYIYIIRINYGNIMKSNDYVEHSTYTGYVYYNAYTKKVVCYVFTYN